MSETTDWFEAIAVVGMAGRFPMASDIDEFWENLRTGKECLTEFSEDEIVASGVPRETLLEKRRRTRGVLDGATDFDARFFGFSHREAEIMDPQQRTFLEVAWEALEDAGYDSERAPGPIGVFAGSGINTYFSANVATRPDILGSFGTFPAVVLNEKDFISTRVAYALDLHGPALTIQTACSTSLVAVCYAAQSLLNYECDFAIAGGAAAVFPQTHSTIHEEGGMISKDGHCRPFDGGASGTLFSDGAGAVILRRLSDAIEDGDHIRAVIRGFAVNNDGAGKAGFTAPSVTGQAEVIQMAQEVGRVSPDSISYIEAHGTATPLGDPIEVAALTEAFRQGTDRSGFCGIGSVKSNIGHLDVAAGIAGLIKTVLSLEHREIPATLNFDGPNPRIDWDASPFYVVDRLTPWSDGPTPRRAGVSSFGIGGTNAHVVLEEAPAPVATDREPRQEQLLVLSAKTPTALEAATSRLADHLKASEDALADIAYTLQSGRREFQHRRAVVVADVADAAVALSASNERRVLTGSTHHRQKPVVFMFSGQGAQYPDMGLGLYETEPEFRAHVDRCAEILMPILSRDIREIIYPGDADRDQAEATLRQTGFTQPALFVVEYALVMLWQSWGVRPTAMVGHSIGEYVAACVSGVFTLEDALALVAARGRLMQGLPTGAMLAVPLTEPEVESLLDDRTCIGVINSEAMCVVSGEIGAIEDLERILEARGVEARRVPTSHAFHSPMMEPILDDFREEIVKAQPTPPQVPFVSNVTGTWITPEEAIDPDYWAQHLRHTVRFSDCLSTLLGEPDRVFLEVGPGRTLGSLVRMHSARTTDTTVVSSTRHPQEERPDAEFILESLGQLWIAGARIDWSGHHGEGRRGRVPLPTYPFERQRYILEPGRPAGFDTPPPSGSTSAESELPNLDRDSGVRVPPGSENGGGATSDDIQLAIASIWEDLLGVSGIGPNESFFDLGGTSLTAARMFALLTQRTGRRLPISTLVNASTIGALARAVREADDESPSLVEIQVGDGSRPPLFLIHAEGGHVLMYRDLARELGPEWSVFGIQSRGLDGESQPSNSIEEMAGRYISEIRSVQAEGPYYLGGWCLGGTIGFEMARQLEEAGERVAWLGMIQSRHPSYWASRDGAPLTKRLAWRAADRTSFESASVAERQGREKMGYVAEKVRRSAMRAWARVPLEGDRGAMVTELAAAGACGRAHLEAYWAYDPPPYDGRVVLVRSSSQPHGIEPDHSLGWASLLQGETEYYEVPSYHGNIIHGERVPLVADIIRSSVQAAIQSEALGQSD
jgi:phthiocerol/phenolphthiocerol synthesis type-I polyketide synthase E